MSPRYFLSLGALLIAVMRRFSDMDCT
jgi:hypothetical protein